MSLRPPPFGLYPQTASSHLLIQVQRRVAQRGRPAIPVIGLQQPMDLTSTEVEPFGSLDSGQVLVTDLLDEFEAMQFFLRYGDQKGDDDSDHSWSRPG